MGEKEFIYVPRVRSFLNEQGQGVPRAFEVMSRRNVGKGVQVKAWVLHHCQVWSLVQLSVGKLGSTSRKDQDTFCYRFRWFRNNKLVRRSWICDLTWSRSGWYTSVAFARRRSPIRHCRCTSTWGISTTWLDLIITTCTSKTTWTCDTLWLTYAKTTPMIEINQLLQLRDTLVIHTWAF